jgi:rhodanese-related sulfurtransferase
MHVDEDVPDMFGSPLPRRVADPRRDSLSVLSERFSATQIESPSAPHGDDRDHAAHAASHQQHQQQQQLRLTRTRLSTNLNAAFSSAASLDSVALLGDQHSAMAMRKRSFDVEDATDAANHALWLRRSNGSVPSLAHAARARDSAAAANDDVDDLRSTGAKVSRSVPDHALHLPADSPDLFARNDVALARRASAAARTPAADPANKAQPASQPTSVPSSVSSSAGSSVRSSALTTPRDTPSPLFRLDAPEGTFGSAGSGLLRAVSSPDSTAKALFAAASASPSAMAAPAARRSVRRRRKQLRGSNGFTSMVDLRTFSASSLATVADLRQTQMLPRDSLFELDDSQPPSNDSSAASTRPQTPQGVPQSPLVPGDFDSDSDEPTTEFVPHGLSRSDATLIGSTNATTTNAATATATTTTNDTICFDNDATSAATGTAAVRGEVDADTDLPESHVQLLPTVRGVHGDLPAINEHTMHRILSGELAERVHNLMVIDCRFPYEFDGGHIRGAMNVFREDQIVAHFFDGAVPRFASETTIVFHCEFSSRRGPDAMKLVRQHDRSLDTWPRLKYPEMYLLEGGYKRYYELSTVHLTPPAYLAMDDPAFAAERAQFMRDRERRSQWRKNKSKSMNALVPNAQLSRSMIDLTRRLSRLDTD